jgi:hypothetical protein
MGIACLLNAQQCGRTHCRYTGPFYLAMIVPVAVVGLGIAPLSPYGWVALGTLILGGGLIIWRVTERAWGNSPRLTFTEWQIGFGRRFTSSETLSFTRFFVSRGGSRASQSKDQRVPQQDI